MLKLGLDYALGIPQNRPCHERRKFQGRGTNQDDGVRQGISFGFKNLIVQAVIRAANIRPQGYNAEAQLNRCVELSSGSDQNLSTSLPMSSHTADGGSTKYR